MGFSYPTVRQKVEQMFNELAEIKHRRVDRLEILGMIRRGEITVEEAENLLMEG